MSLPVCATGTKPSDYQAIVVDPQQSESIQRCKIGQGVYLVSIGIGALVTGSIFAGSVAAIVALDDYISDSGSGSGSGSGFNPNNGLLSENWAYIISGTIGGLVGASFTAICCHRGRHK